MLMGLTLVRIAVAQLVHCFDWEVPRGGDQLDMEEGNGIITGRAHHLLAVPSYRLVSG